MLTKDKKRAIRQEAKANGFTVRIKKDGRTVEAINFPTNAHDFAAWLGEVTGSDFGRIDASCAKMKVPVYESFVFDTDENGFPACTEIRLRDTNLISLMLQLHNAGANFFHHEILMYEDDTPGGTQEPIASARMEDVDEAIVEHDAEDLAWAINE